MTIVDVVLTVNTSWDLEGGGESDGGPVTPVNSSTYTSLLTLDLLTNDGVGTYTCRVNVSSQSPFITGTQSAQASTDITICKRITFYAFDPYYQYSHYL